jgi:hypothetical protein
MFLATNDHEYYFQSEKLSAGVFLLPFVNIRVHSWLKFLFDDDSIFC